MRDTLKQAVRQAICFEYEIPDSSHSLLKSNISNENDMCFSNAKWIDISNIIYNGIVEFAVNEFEINYDNLELEQRKVVARKMRYDTSASEDAKIKYGFYGEVLLDLILRCFFNTEVLLARGYLYSPIENSEVKGFDAFHLMQIDDKLSLWLGEAKFYINYKTPITDVLKKLKTTLSDEYINKNLLALIDWQSRFTTTDSKLKHVLDKWESNPDINLACELKNNQITITYPVFIAYQKEKKDGLNDSIQKCIQHVNDTYSQLSLNTPSSFNYTLFFVFLPLEEVKKIKLEVIDCIENKKPLI